MVLWADTQTWYVIGMILVPDAEGVDSYCKMTRLHEAPMDDAEWHSKVFKIPNWKILKYDIPGIILIVNNKLNTRIYIILIWRVSFALWINPCSKSNIFCVYMYAYIDYCRLMNFIKLARIQYVTFKLLNDAHVVTNSFIMTVMCSIIKLTYLT